MKKFQFSMDKVLDYKTHIQKNEKEILAQMRLKHVKLCDEREALISSYNEYIDEYIHICKAGISVQNMITFRTYINEIQIKISKKEKGIKDSLASIDKQINKVIDITKGKVSLEKLKDKYFNEYQSEQRKAHEIFITEFIANTGLSAYRQLS